MVGSKGVNRISLSVLLTIVAACGQPSGELKHRSVVAPQSEDQMGYVLDLSQEGLSEAKTESLIQDLEDWGGTVRTINAAHGLFEVYGLSQMQIERLAPAQSIQKNKFWKLRRESLNTQDFMESYCPQVVGAPKMVLKALPTEKNIVPEEPSILARDLKPITLSVSFPAGASTYRWEVYAPGSSAANGLKVADNNLTFTPDELGEYNVFLLVKMGPNKMCWRRFLIGVTDNAAFKGPSGEVPLPVDERIQKFAHLSAIGVKSAWTKTQGEKVMIAILDTGVDYNHPDISGAVQTNPADRAGDKTDSDNNKFVDDFVGWDFVNNDNSPFDDQMHGTHVAGLAGSLVGVAPKASLLAVKVLGPFGGDMATLAGGIYYAVDRGAKIINMSLGGPGNSPVLKRAFDYAQQRGVLVVVAAGNDAEDIDINPTYPASLPHANILTVAATDLQGNLTDYTNTGATAVDVACPGGSDADGGLLSTFYGNRLNRRYVRAQGTSMASPVVAGVAALVLSANPTFKATEIKNHIIGRGLLRNDYQGKVGAKKLVSAANLFAAAPVPQP